MEDTTMQWESNSCQSVEEGSRAGVMRSRFCRRQAQRLRQPRPIKIVPCNGGKLQPPTTVSLQDLSLSGMGLTHGEPLLPGLAFFVPSKRPQPESASRL